MPSKPERWRIDAADAVLARLEIPADLHRVREFEIAVAMTARVPASGRPWHELRIEVDGLLQWQRRLDSHNPGSHDGLEYRLRRTVPVGRPLRLLARAECGGGARRATLVIEADET